MIDAPLLCPRPSPAIVTMLSDQPKWTESGDKPLRCQSCTGLDFNAVTYIALELFKLTIGQGNLNIKARYSDVHAAIQHGVSWFMVC